MPDKKAETPSDINEECRESMAEHSRELRRRILRCLILVLIFWIVLVTFWGTTLMAAVLEPLKSRGIQVIYLNLSEALTAQMKVAFITSAILSMPYIFFNIWRFIGPALKKNEKITVIKMSFYSLFLFILGIFFGYGMVFLTAVTFFVQMGENLAVPMLSISRYVDFLFSFILPFGLIFEEPIIIYFLCRMQMIHAETLVRIRKYMILVTFIVAGLLTPPDITSQLMMAVPMLFLYEVGIWVARKSERKVSVLSNTELHSVHS